MELTKTSKGSWCCINKRSKRQESPVFVFLNKTWLLLTAATPKVSTRTMNSVVGSPPGRQRVTESRHHFIHKIEDISRNITPVSRSASNRSQPSATSSRSELICPPDLEEITRRLSSSTCQLERQNPLGFLEEVFQTAGPDILSPFINLSVSSGSFPKSFFLKKCISLSPLERKKKKPRSNLLGVVFRP